jgi:hypothetical protein
LIDTGATSTPIAPYDVARFAQRGAAGAEAAARTPEVSHEE